MFAHAGLHSSRIGEQCEAVVKFPALVERFPFPILINAAFLKLVDVFRTGLVKFVTGKHSTCSIYCTIVRGNIQVHVDTYVASSPGLPLLKRPGDKAMYYVTSSPGLPLSNGLGTRLCIMSPRPQGSPSQMAWGRGYVLCHLVPRAPPLKWPGDEAVYYVICCTPEVHSEAWSHPPLYIPSTAVALIL